MNKQCLASSGENSYQIPIDLLIDIFLRVPPKSIARFRCVSKFWSSMLSRPDFTEPFFANSLTRPRLLFTFGEDGKLFFYSSHQPQNPDEESSPVLADHQAYISTDDVFSTICRPVNGLICRQQQPKGTESVTVVYNISTGESITSPEVRTEIVDSRSYFGYDPIDKQFKVLCMTWYHGGAYNYSVEHRVLTLGNQERVWRKLEDCRRHYPLYDGICINGALYYQAEGRRRSGVSMIVCFDIKSEKFSYINIDQYMVIERASTLIDYKGKLGVVHGGKFRNLVNGSFQGVNQWTITIEMWILEDAEKHKWLKHSFPIPRTESWGGDYKPYLYFVGLTRTGEIVLSPYYLLDPFYVVYYNIERKTMRRVEIQGFKERKYHPRVHMFIDYVENVTPMRMLG